MLPGQLTQTSRLEKPDEVYFLVLEFSLMLRLLYRECLSVNIYVQVAYFKGNLGGEKISKDPIFTFFNVMRYHLSHE